MINLQVGSSRVGTAVTSRSRDFSLHIIVLGTSKIDSTALSSVSSRSNKPSRKEDATKTILAEGLSCYPRGNSSSSTHQYTSSFTPTNGTD